MRKKLSKHDDTTRKLASFKRHCWFLFQPLLLAFLASVIWNYTLFKYKIHFDKEDEGPLLTGVIVILAVAYGIMTTSTFESVYGKHQKSVISVLKKDRETFLCYRDERIPIIIHLLIITFSALLLGIVSLIAYKTLYAGLVSVFSVSFVLSLYWLVIIELQNPAKSLWFIERTPNEWLTIDIDDAFKLGEGHEEI